MKPNQAREASRQMQIRDAPPEVIARYCRPLPGGPVAKGATAKGDALDSLIGRPGGLPGQHQAPAPAGRPRAQPASNSRPQSASSGPSIFGKASKVTVGDVWPDGPPEDDIIAPSQPQRVGAAKAMAGPLASGLIENGRRAMPVPPAPFPSTTELQAALPPSRGGTPLNSSWGVGSFSSGSRGSLAPPADFSSAFAARAAFEAQPAAGSRSGQRTNGASTFTFG